MKCNFPYVGVCLLATMSGGCASLSAVGERLSGLELDSSTYVAGHGESLETIAFRYNIPVDRLKTMNPGLELVPGAYVLVRSPEDLEIAGSANAGKNHKGQKTAEVSVSDTKQQETSDSVDTSIASAVEIPQAIVMESDRKSDDTLLGRTSSTLNTQQSDNLVGDDQYAHLEEEIIEEETFGLKQTVNAAFAERLSLDTENSTMTVARSRANGSEEWQWPTNGPVARDYDARKPNGRGIDIAGVPGQDVYAVKDGVVTFSGRDPSGVGKLVIVRHDDDYLSIYSHTRDLFVSETDTVRAGDPIASLGANANDEAMLRFELRRSGKLLNPIEYLSPL